MSALGAVPLDQQFGNGLYVVCAGGALSETTSIVSNARLGVFGFGGTRATKPDCEEQRRQVPVSPTPNLKVPAGTRHAEGAEGGKHQAKD